MKIKSHIFIFLSLALLISCSGSRKYFKAAEKLEKQGLVNEAAEFYLEALQRKPTNTDARIKLTQVGQKHVSNLSSEFFRNYNTQQTEACISTFERLKLFNEKCSALGVRLDYPRSYEEDYQKAIDQYLVKNYSQAYQMVTQKRFSEAQGFIQKIDKYNTGYRNIRQLDVIATCEPLYQSAINNLQLKNYSSALNLLTQIKNKAPDYKDSKDLLELATARDTKSFILFAPAPAVTEAEKRSEQYLFDRFGEFAMKEMSSVRLINNTPFQTAPQGTDFYNSNNVDLVQAIRKATGADYFYFFDVANSTEYNSGLKKSLARGFREYITKVNDSTTTKEYKPFDYNVVNAERSFAFDFRYKLVNAYTSQVVSAQTQQVSSRDAVEYNEFRQKFDGNINSLYPSDPSKNPLGRGLAVNSWRQKFSGRSDLKSMDELRNDVLGQTINIFKRSTASMR